MADIIYLIITLIGILSSLIGSIIGAGGGFLNVPFLIFLGYTEYSSGISLFAIIFNALFSSIFNIHKKIVDFKIALIFIPFVILGSFIGAYIFDLLKSTDINLFKLLFTILLIILGLKIYFKKENEVEEIKIIKIEQYNKKNIIFGIIGGLSIGIVSGCLGIGGGIVAVPYLNLLIGIPIHVAIGTSLFIMIFTSSAGVVSHILNGNLPLFAITLGIFLAIGAVFGSNAGSRVAYKIKDKRIRKIYGIIMVFIAIPLIWLRILLPFDPIQTFIDNFFDIFSNFLS